MATVPKPPESQEARVDLSLFPKGGHKPGAGLLKRTIWYFTNVLFFLNPWNPFSGLKVFLLRLFGAKVGKGVIIKPAVNIKYPWKLHIEDYVWIGEKVWIDNLEEVKIGTNSCISQGALLEAGSHSISAPNFHYKGSGITLEDGVWIGTRAIVAQGVHCGSHSVLSFNSVAQKDLEAYMIYRGNPAEPLRRREIKRS